MIQHKENFPLRNWEIVSVNPSEKNCILASYKFGGHLIPSIVAKDNIIGCQFHPEKSGPSGLNIIRNFISI